MPVMCVSMLETLGMAWTAYQWNGPRKLSAAGIVPLPASASASGFFMSSLRRGLLQSMHERAVLAAAHNDSLIHDAALSTRPQA